MIRLFAARQNRGKRGKRKGGKRGSFLIFKPKEKGGVVVPWEEKKLGEGKERLFG